MKKLLVQHLIHDDNHHYKLSINPGGGGYNREICNDSKYIVIFGFLPLNPLESSFWLWLLSSQLSVLVLQNLWNIYNVKVNI